MKIQLLTSIKGHQVWERGTIMTSPFPADVQSLVNDPRVIKILEKDEPIVKIEESKENEQAGKVETIEVVVPKVEVEEVKEKVVSPSVVKNALFTKKVEVKVVTPKAEVKKVVLPATKVVLKKKG